MEGLRTINLGDRGAFNASPTLCKLAPKLALILPLLVLIVLIASLKLCCLPCLLPPVPACPFRADTHNELSRREFLGSTGKLFSVFGLGGYGDCPFTEST